MSGTATAPVHAPLRIPRMVPIITGGVLALAAVAAGLLQGESPTEQALLAARYTARAGAILFLLPFLIGPVARMWRTPLILALRQRRRHLGLGFALAHFIHLGALTSFFVVSGESPGLQTIVFGGFGYLLIGLMALTSNDASMRMLGRNWQRLHLFGIYYVWFIFTFSYFGRLGDPDRFWIGAVGLPVLLAALALRLALPRLAARR